MADIREIEAHLNELLQAGGFQDYGPNGLQVEGIRPPRRLAAAVSVSMRSIEAAAAWGADVLLVHHGLFWYGQPCVLEGSHRARVAALLESGMSVLAYHLPLDAHESLGNAAVIADALGVDRPREPFGRHKGAHLGWWGSLREPMSPHRVQELLDQLLGPGGTFYDSGPDEIRRVAVATGAAPHLIRDAIRLGLDLYVTGETTEYVQELAREEGIHFAAKGHYRTETVGVKALAGHLADRFGLEWTFMDVPNDA